MANSKGGVGTVTGAGLVGWMTGGSDSVGTITAEGGGVLELGSGGGAVAARLMESTSKARDEMEDLKSCIIAIMSKAMLGPGIAVVGGAVGVGGAFTVDVVVLGSNVGGIAGMDEGNLGRRGVTEGLRSMLVRSAFSGSTPVGVERL